VPERLDNILGAGRHVACDASSHTFLREIPGSLAKPLALGLPSRRPPARDPATSRPAQSSANCSATAAPGFFNAFLMLGAPQIGVRHSRRLTGVRKVTRQQWDTGHVWDDEIGVSTSLAPKFPNISVPYGALVPERLDNILGAGRHVACDASSHTFLREIPGSLAKPLALGLPSRRPPARDPATSRPAQSSANCSAKGSICRPRSKPPCSRLRPRSDVGTPKWSWLPLDYPPKRFERNFRGLASSLDAVREA
jgi:hypothetical protein